MTHPDPFTIISHQDVVSGKWKPRSDLKIPLHTLDANIFGALDDVLRSDGTIDLYQYAMEYTKRLEAKGKFQLCIWPEHCLIGSPGHAMVDVVFDAVQYWSLTTGGSVEWILKGENLLTESYSALEAEVPVNAATSFNAQLQSSLEQSDHVILCGQAMSHCVNYTTRSIIERWPNEDLGKITLLTDCCSAVPGFEDEASSFQKEVAEVGVQLATSTELFK
jgi:nicotinamidase-related amidase